MYEAIQSFLIDMIYLLAAFLWWKSATAAPQSTEEDAKALKNAYKELDTAVELVYISFDKKLASSKSPFNPHVRGSSMLNASAALCTAMAVFLQFIKDFMAPWCEDQGMVVAVMLFFLVLVFMFPFLKFFFKKWKF